MAKTVTFKGNPMTLLGKQPKEGSRAPDFKVISPDLQEVTLADFKGKTKIITTFLSLDTPVCDLQVKEFNKRATAFSSGVAVIGISMDLPFAQKRFCQMNEIKNAVVLSDYRFSSFGKNYGLIVKELNLLVRAVLVVDKEDRLRYLQVVDEMTNPPDYDQALRRLEEIINNG
jgi:thioredoxin-dependent peroxiredoxin